MSHPLRPQPVSPSPDRRRYSSSHRRDRDSPRRRRPSDSEGTLYDNPRLSPRSRLSPDKAYREFANRRTSSSQPPPVMSSLLGVGVPSRKRSLIRPERNRIDKNHPNFHYRQHAADMPVRPSATGNDPLVEESGAGDTARSGFMELREIRRGMVGGDTSLPASPERERTRSRRKSDALCKSESRSPTKSSFTRQGTRPLNADAKRRKAKDAAQALTLWKTWCHLVTFWCPDFLLRWGGKQQKEQQTAWREKMGLCSIIALICAFIGYITFGFSATVCPAGSTRTLRNNQVGDAYVIINGEAYDLTKSSHPAAAGVPAGSNVLYDLPVKYGGMDISFMFQNVNGDCKGLITAANDSDVPTNDAGDLGWYFPCNAFKQDGSSKPNETISYYLGYACHLSTSARNAYYNLKVSSDVSFTWEDVNNASRNLAVYQSNVLDFDLLEWFNTSQVSYPAKFDEIRTNSAIRGQDLTLSFSTTEERRMLKCFSEIIKVGTVDTLTVGCIASRVVLYIALAFILSVTMIKFLLALLFQWILCKKYEPVKGVRNAESKRRKQEIEDWTDDIYRPAPKGDDQTVTLSERSKRSSAFLPTTSRFTSPYAIERTLGKNRPTPTTMASQSSTARLIPGASNFASSEMTLPYHNRASLLMSSNKSDNRFSTFMADADSAGPAGFVHEAVVPQPPTEWQPYGYPLAHAICLVTCYSEGANGIRTTMDSIATTDYPNSHKLILVMCDGLVKGAGEYITTPEAVLGMMKEHTILPDEVQPFSYVAVASGSKRHNMAKIYSGFYDYGESSVVPHDMQQRVPMVVVVKCGTPDEANKSKPGNRGKRDSQVILMSFLQKVMFDERMTELEYEMFNGIWKITGLSPDFYEVILMVDADTKIFPDSVTHMVSAMVKDPEIMGLCGETKIANKRDSWITMIQVFEYFISHHLAKSFESVFGGVTCLPGCFSMYRIKAPKGGQNYWVPILANPDIVEHYSENVVDTLHKKNLFLLGEDRYLSTLMLKTFPKRKQVFVPQAVCKTTVPDSFKVLLSQRRRWINSTIHNLMELILVRDLCGTFCFSMQFVVFIELIGTFVLPAAIAFSVYLITATIVDAVRHFPIPVIPLCLLALILGLPALLIVLTASRWSYVLWMFMYLASLPIWNGILPLYAFWKFDDFSWGDTRRTEGEITGAGKGGHEAEGEFDSSRITMKRWVDFEQERRSKSGSTVAGRKEEGIGRGRQSQYEFAAPPSAWNGGGGNGARRSKSSPDFLKEY